MAAELGQRTAPPAASISPLKCGNLSPDNIKLSELSELIVEKQSKTRGTRDFMGKNRETATKFANLIPRFPSILVNP